MPISFHLFRVNSLKHIEKYETTWQLEWMKDDDPLKKEHFKSEYARSRAGFIDGYDEYDASHEFLVQLKMIGRARGIEFTQYVTPYRFKMYLQSGADTNSYLLVRTKSKVALDFVKRLNAAKEGIEIGRVAVNVTQMRPYCVRITGAWFGELLAANISTTAVFGDQVDRSKEFEHAESIGKLTSIMIGYPMSFLENRLCTFQITADGVIVLYDNLDEECSLRAVVALRENLIDRCLLNGPAPSADSETAVSIGRR